jgi:hypothetical protein
MIPRWPIAIAVGVGHAAALALLLGPGVRGRSDDQVANETVVTTASLIIEEKHSPVKEPAPEITLASPQIHPTALQEIEFISDEWGDVSGVVAPASAPQLSRFQPVEAATFARRAGLGGGISGRKGRGGSDIQKFQRLKGGRGSSLICQAAALDTGDGGTSGKGDAR